jgi:Protein of unknown function with HXXEE motif
MTRVALLLPLALVLHVAEEWFGGLSEWTGIVFGNAIPPGRFLLINGIGIVIFGSGTVLAFRSSRWAWFCTAFAALVGLNGVLHALATMGFGRYSPGLVTGLVLYIPLSIIVLRSEAQRLPKATFIRSCAAGMVVHGLVTLLAFS